MRIVRWWKSGRCNRPSLGMFRHIWPHAFIHYSPGMDKCLCGLWQMCSLECDGAREQPDSVERLKQAIETLRCIRPDVRTEAGMRQAGDPMSPWSHLVAAERLILVYGSGSDEWAELDAFLADLP